MRMFINYNSEDFDKILNAPAEWFFLGAKAGDWYQAVGSFCAGVLALAAGWLAYTAAMQSNKRAASDAAKLNFSYGTFVFEGISEMYMVVVTNYLVCKNHPEQARRPINIPNSLDSSNWTKIGLLEISTQEKIFRVKLLLETYRSLIESLETFKQPNQLSEENHQNITTLNEVILDLEKKLKPELEKIMQDVKSDYQGISFPNE